MVITKLYQKQIMISCHPNGQHHLMLMLWFLNCEDKTVTFYHICYTGSHSKSIMKSNT